MLSFRHKLYLSYTPIIVILVLVGGWSVYSLVWLGDAIDAILVHNYESILAATGMKQQLEREDTSALLYLAGDKKRALVQFNLSSQAFESQLQITSNNITEPGEDRIVSDIRSQYEDYYQAVKRVLAPPGVDSPASGPPARYLEQIAPRSAELTTRLDDLLNLNQEALFRTKDKAAQRSFRAQLSAGILAAIGVALSLLFAWRFVGFVVKPVTALSEKARLISEGHYDRHIDIQSDDEIGEIAPEFNRMAAKLIDLQRSDYARLLIEKKKSDAVINCIREPVIVTDSLGALVKLNDAAVSLIGDWTTSTGGEEKDDPGIDNETRLSDTGLIVLRIIHDSLSGRRPPSERPEELLVPVNIGGNQRNYRLRTAPMRGEDGRLLGSVTLLEDASSIIEVERIKSEFVSIAAETLESPLKSLRLSLYALAEGKLGELSEKQADMLQVARDDSEQLDKIVNDLVEIAALDSGAKRLSIEGVRPIDLTRPAIARQQPYAEANRVLLNNKVWSDLPRVNADKDAMKLVLDNLLSNAIRHTAREGQVTVEAWERHDLIFFSVRDTGEGIPSEYLSSLFTGFTRIPGRPSRGTGLGGRRPEAGWKFERRIHPRDLSIQSINTSAIINAGCFAKRLAFQPSR